MRCHKAAAVALVCAIPVIGCGRDPVVKSRDLANRAAQYAQQKKTSEAILEYRKAIAANPRNADARVALAKLYSDNGDVQNASAEYARAADLLPQNVDVQLHAGGLMLLVGRFEDARARADRVLKAEPKNVDAFILRGNALAGLKDFKAAIAAVELAVETDPSSSAAQADLGALQFAKGDAPAAAAAFKKAVATDPKSVNARLALANYYWTTNQKTDAEKALLDTIALDPKNLLANGALAMLYMGSDRRAAAEQPMKVFAEVSPQPRGMLALADYYATMQRYPEAKAILDRVSRDPAGSVAAKLRLVSLGLASGDRAQSYRIIDDLLKSNPKQFDALVAKARLQMAEGKMDDALTSAKAAVAAKPDSAQVQFVLGTVLNARNQREDATQAFNEALKQNPAFVPAQVELAKIALVEGRNDDAVQLATSVLHNTPGYAEAYLLLARAQLAANNVKAAEQALNVLESALPSNLLVQTELGRLYVAQGDRTKARTVLEQVIKQAPAEIDALQSLVLMDVQDGKPAEARARIEAALAAAPNSGDVRVLAGRVYAAANDFKQAELSFRRAIELNANNIQAYAGLAQSFVMQRRLPEATEEFEKLAVRQPKSAQPQTVVGLLLQLQNKTNEAKERYQKALEIDAHAAVAANNLAWLYAQENERLDVALALAQTAKAGMPNRHEVDDTLGWIYYKKGLSTLALASFKECVRSQPQNASYVGHLGLAYAQSGDKRKARESLEQALKLSGTFDGADEARKVLKSLQS